MYFLFFFRILEVVHLLLSIRNWHLHSLLVSNAVYQSLQLRIVCVVLFGVSLDYDYGTASIDGTPLTRLVQAAAEARQNANARAVAQQMHLTGRVRDLAPLAHTIAATAWERNREMATQGATLRLGLRAQGSRVGMATLQGLGSDQ